MAACSETIEASVITSSSTLSLNLLLKEIDAIHHVRTIDVSIFRDVDIDGIKKQPRFKQAWQSASTLYNDNKLPLPADPIDATSLARSLKHFEMRKIVIEWFANELELSGVGQINVTAFATYFPGISSMNGVRRGAAVEALTGTILLALHMKEANSKIDMKIPIVEIVCGTVVETCQCAKCNKNAFNNAKPGPVFVYKPSAKRDQLINSLAEVISEVDTNYPSTEYGIALELEPGAVYLLGNVARLTALFAAIESFIAPNSANITTHKDNIRKHVGLNLDVTHMLIAKISAEQLDKFFGFVMHAHISDGPHLHTRDQIVGSWTSVQSLKGEYHKYLSLMHRRSVQCGIQKGLPFSNSIALELEGCDRPSWIHHSLTAMKQLLLTAASYDNTRTA